VAGRAGGAAGPGRGPVWPGGAPGGGPGRWCWGCRRTCHAGTARRSPGTPATPTPTGREHLLVRAVWDHDKVRDDVRGDVVEHLGDPRRSWWWTRPGPQEGDGDRWGQAPAHRHRRPGRQRPGRRLPDLRPGTAWSTGSWSCPRAGPMLLSACGRPASPTRLPLRPRRPWPRPWSAARWTPGPRGVGHRRRGLQRRPRAAGHPGGPRRGLRAGGGLRPPGPLRRRQPPRRRPAPASQRGHGSRSRAATAPRATATTTGHSSAWTTATATATATTARHPMTRQASTGSWSAATSRPASWPATAAGCLARCHWQRWSGSPGPGGRWKSASRPARAFGPGPASGPPLALLVPVGHPGPARPRLPGGRRLTDHARHPPPSGPIGLTCNEVGYLFAALAARPTGPPAAWTTGCAGRCGDADTKPGPGAARTDGKPPSNHAEQPSGWRARSRAG
jgi:hypothetical protein